MEQITMIGIDLAKQVFQIHGVDRRGNACVRKQLRRSQLLPAYSAEDDRLFRRNVTGYCAEFALAGFSTLAGHDRSRFRAQKWPRLLIQHAK